MSSPRNEVIHKNITICQNHGAPDAGRDAGAVGFNGRAVSVGDDAFSN